VAEGVPGRAVLAFLPLYAEADQEDVAREWAAQVGAEKDERVRADLGGLARVFAVHAGRMAVWGPILEGMSMETSPFLDEVRAQNTLRNLR
jgi:hypothetical protein